MSRSTLETLLHDLPPRESVALNVRAEQIQSRVAQLLDDTHLRDGAWLQTLAQTLRSESVSTQHRRFFGPPHGKVDATAVWVEALLAHENPQLAVPETALYLHALEDTLLTRLASSFGFSAQCDAVFTQGCAESNLLAVQTALTKRFPQARTRGLRSLSRAPTVYGTRHTHSTVLRAVRVSGLGDDAMRWVETDAAGRMNPSALDHAIAQDCARNDAPLLVVATLGTTTSGSLDALDHIADVVARHDVDLHVDAAWGGMLAFDPACAAHLKGLEHATSLAFDPHKAWSCALGAGFFVHRQSHALSQTFGVRSEYMPQSSSHPFYQRGVTWSRRACAPRVLAGLVGRGWSSLASLVQQRLQLIALLREALVGHDWTLHNETPLPLVVFRSRSHDDRGHAQIARHVCSRGRAWLSPVRDSAGRLSLRACINHPDTSLEDLHILVDALAKARAETPSRETTPTSHATRHE